jgi:hypothetical protein
VVVAQRKQDVSKYHLRPWARGHFEDATRSSMLASP